MVRLVHLVYVVRPPVYLVGKSIFSLFILAETHLLGPIYLHYSRIMHSDLHDAKAQRLDLSQDNPDPIGWDYSFLSLCFHPPAYIYWVVG